MRELPVRFHSNALLDLRLLASFLRRNGASRQVAHDFVARIRVRCEKIGHAPYGHPARDDLAVGLRIAPFEHSAIIAYRVEDDTVMILRIFYGGRDYAALV